MTPLILYFIAPYFTHEFLTNWAQFITTTDKSVTLQAATERVSDPVFQMYAIWKFIVKPIAIGGMLMGALYTLFKMRKSLAAGIGRSITDVKKAASGSEVSAVRTEKDLKFSWVLIGIAGVAVATFLITKFIFGTDLLPAIVAATVMIILAFFFAAISGYLVGIMGSSNNPISGLTLTALVVTALILVSMGVDATHGGIAAVLGVAAIVCVSAASRLALIRKNQIDGSDRQMNGWNRSKQRL